MCWETVTWLSLLPRLLHGFEEILEKRLHSALGAGTHHFPFPSREGGLGWAGLDGLGGTGVSVGMAWRKVWEGHFISFTPAPLSSR